MSTKEDAVKSTKKQLDANSADNINAIQLLLKTIKSDEKDNFDKLIISEEIFKKINENLIAIINSIEKNPSMLSRAAKIWSTMPLWQKIVGGVVLTVPLLIIGIAAHLVFFLALCGIAGAIYVGTGILLDDHESCNTSVTKSLTTGILGLAELLELTIMALDTIRKKLGEEANKFILENEKLQTNVDELQTKIVQLGIEVKEAHELTLSLKKIKIELEQTSTNLSVKITEQSTLLNNHHHQLKLITEAYQSSQIELDKKINELAQVKSNLERELSIANALAHTLGATLQEVSSSIIGDKEKQKEMLNRITEFLNHKEASFASVATRICAAEEQLQKRTAELKHCNAQYKGYLEEQARQIQQLKTIIRKQSKGVISDSLRNLGIFAPDTLNPIPPMPTKSAATP